MPIANLRQKTHPALFIFVIVSLLILFGLWLSQRNDEADLTHSFETSKTQNRAFVYSNAATQNYFDAQNAFVDYLHSYRFEALDEYRHSLDRMGIYLDSLNRLVKEDRHFWYSVTRKKNKEQEIIALHKQLDALLKGDVHRLTKKSTDRFMLAPYDYDKVLQSIAYDSIRIADEVLKKGMLRRIGDAIVGKYDVRREELQVYMKVMYGNAKKTGDIEDQMRYIFKSTSQYYNDEFGTLRNTYTNLRERDHELMAINKKILKNSQEILLFYTQSAQESSQQQFEKAMENIHNKKNLIGWLLFAVALFTVLLARYAWLAHQNQKALAAAKTATERNLAFKSRIIGMLNHEMRAPLNIIANLTRKIKSANADKSLGHSVNLLHFTSNSLEVSVNQILDFSKNQHTELTLHNTKINLRKEIGHILDSLQSLTDLKKIQLETRINVSLEEKVMADSGKIHQLFYNIVGNAIKFTNKGSITVECQLLQADNWHRLDVVIKDTGVGMSQKDLERVFDNNFEDKPYKNNIGFSAGLGMNLCREIVELYDGKITIDSQPEQGTEVAFSLFFEKTEA